MGLLRPTYQGHWHRHGLVSYLWLPSVILSNYGPISYGFWDKRQFRSKITNFSYPMYYLVPRWGGFHWNFVTAVEPKTSMLPIQCDGQTERHQKWSNNIVLSMPRMLTYNKNHFMTWSWIFDGERQSHDNNITKTSFKIQGLIKDLCNRMIKININIYNLHFELISNYKNDVT